MACPYLKEVVMLFCDAYPVKKMLPLDRIATADPCLGQFHCCPVFRDGVVRLNAVSGATAPAETDSSGTALSPDRPR
jgi:hypothetical protein